MTLAFQKNDQILNNLGLTQNEKTQIYKSLAAILHLGNTEFINVESNAKILESSRIHMENAAKLLRISSDDLENSLRLRSIEVHGNLIT